MADGSGVSGARYRAFISYSHRDAAFAARLHRRLEGYVLPKRLGAGRRLTPIFKDREELPAAHDLSAQVRAALAASDCLIVVCSPDAAASPWVGREIELFRELHPERPILAALVRGEPAEAFPPALADDGVEPLAADFRKEADGERLALLKLVAGIAGVGVDQLVQRDAQRRLRSVMAVTAVAVAGMLAMGGMTLVALEAQAEAERQRAQAESMAEFMLGDLRQQLRAVGRYTVLNSVNQRVLAYYNTRDKALLSDDSLQRRSRLLHAIGEDELGQGRPDNARSFFNESYSDTARLLARKPQDPERLFTHAQSAYWRGYYHFGRRETRVSRMDWEEYRAVSLRLLAVQPKAVRSVREVAYADGNLCSLATEQEGDLGRALSICLSALRGMQAAWAIHPDDPDVALDLGTRWAKLADVQAQLGDYPAARKSRLAQASILRALLDKYPDNATFRDNWGVCHRGLASIAFREGSKSEALGYIEVAKSTFLGLSKMDPANARWREQAAFAEEAIRKLTNELEEKERR